MSKPAHPTPPQLCLRRHLLELVSSKDTQKLEVPGGHTGIVGGSVGPKHSWPQDADWLTARS